MTVEPHPHHARIASDLPGRLRVKLAAESRAPHVLDGIQRRLTSHPGIHGVRVDAGSGSVTVDYDREHHGTSGVLGLLADCDCIIHNLGTTEQSATLASNADFLAAVDDLSARLAMAAGIPIDLKVVFPLTFLGAGLWAIGKRGLMLDVVPGWVFLWLALDSFVKFHPASAPERAR